MYGGYPIRQQVTDKPKFCITISNHFFNSSKTGVFIP
jgi:hypothetical protein